MSIKFNKSNIIVKASFQSWPAPSIYLQSRAKHIGNLLSSSENLDLKSKFNVAF